jgi:hypothetical protein
MKLKELGLRKNFTEAELLTIDGHLQLRQGRPTEARFGGRIMPLHSLKRRIKNARRAHSKAGTEGLHLVHHLVGSLLTMPNRCRRANFRNIRATSRTV